MSTLRERVASFQVFPKYGIQIGEDNADLLIGMVGDDIVMKENERIAELEKELSSVYGEIADSVRSL